MAHLGTSKASGSLTQYLSTWNTTTRTGEFGGGLRTGRAMEHKGVGVTD